LPRKQLTERVCLRPTRHDPVEHIGQISQGINGVQLS
jgi:hypothetical protein